MSRGSTFAVILLAGAALAALGTPPVLDAVEPGTVRIYQMVTLRGSGFGAFDPGVSTVAFDDGTTVRSVGAPYVWRDDFIQVRVPSGITTDEVSVSVTNASGATGVLTARMARPSGTVPALVYSQRTNLVNDFDVSGFLGAGEHNRARTKDADIGFIDDDAFPDIIDNNGNNDSNGTHEIIHLNQRGLEFRSRLFEPVFQGQPGSFATVVPPGGDYVDNAICYDADLIDLNNDGLDDWVQAAANSPTSRVRVLINNQPEPGRFVESTSTWIPSQTSPGSPDDVASTDIDGDGFLDVAVSYRFSSSIAIFMNDGGTGFEPQQLIEQPGFASLHDVFFLDANDDDFWDFCTGNESGDCQVMLHDGNLADPGFGMGATIDFSAETGVAGDLTNNGLDDMVLAWQGARAYLNQPGQIGTFFEVILNGAPSGTIYDSELGDADLDGDLDITIAVITTSANNTCRLWLNEGGGSFTNVTDPGMSALFPNPANFQRLSTDFIDFDLDGDLDFYITGADGAGIPGGIGIAPNQFWENHLVEVFASTGNGLAGTNGVPVLDGAGSLAAGGKLELSLADALEDSTTTLFVGFSAIDAPFKGGTLVPAPDILIAGLPTGAAGQLELNATWPEGVPSGTTVWLQHWITDPAGPKGLAASNGLSATTP